MSSREQKHLDRLVIRNKKLKAEKARLEKEAAVAKEALKKAEEIQRKGEARRRLRQQLIDLGVLVLPDTD